MIKKMFNTLKFCLQHFKVLFSSLSLNADKTNGQNRTETFKNLFHTSLMMRWACGEAT